MEGVRLLHLDARGGWLYWYDGQNQYIARVPLFSTTIPAKIIVCSSSSICSNTGLQDQVTSLITETKWTYQLFWTTAGLGYVGRVKVDGSTPYEWLACQWEGCKVNTTRTFGATDLRIDDRVKPAVLYWATYTSVFRAAVPSVFPNSITEIACPSGCPTTLVEPGNSDRTISLDLISPYPSIYMTDGSRIRRSNLDGTNSSLILCASGCSNRPVPTIGRIRFLQIFGGEGAQLYWFEYGVTLDNYGYAHDDPGKERLRRSQPDGTSSATVLAGWNAGGVNLQRAPRWLDGAGFFTLDAFNPAKPPLRFLTWSAGPNNNDSPRQNAAVVVDLVNRKGVEVSYQSTVMGAEYFGVRPKTGGSFRGGLQWSIEDAW
jgi:hypothetical protein